MVLDTLPGFDLLFTEFTHNRRFAGHIGYTLRTGKSTPNESTIVAHNETPTASNGGCIGTTETGPSCSSNRTVLISRMTQVLAEAEALQAQIRNYLRSVERVGDLDRIAQRIALQHSRGSRVVGFRRSGRELFVHEADRADGGNLLAMYQVERDGKLLQTGTVWKGKELDSWLDEHSFYLEWIAPEWR